MMGLSRAFALVAFSAGIAMAQPKHLMPPTAAQKADIERLSKQAIAKSQKGDHEGAIKDYLDAYAIHPSTVAVLLSNVGHEYRELKKPYEALKYFCMYLEKEPTGSAAGYAMSEATGIWKELGKDGEVCKKAEPTPPEKNPDPIDNGQVTGTEPIKQPPPPPPKSNAGGGMRLAGLGIAGAGVVALGAGFLFGSKAASKSDEISKGPPLDASGNQVDWGPHPELGWDGIAKLEKDGESAEKMQITLSVVGGAMVIGGTALYFLGRSKKSSETNVTANVTKDGGGLVYFGRF